jgi:hypothetical protein
MKGCGKAYDPEKPTAFWQRNRPLKLNAEKRSQMKVLDDERRATLKEILGTEVSPQSVIDQLFLQTRGDASVTAFLPEEKREAARAALERADSQVVTA